jgi:tetratricopeptide (TPR) repeat protein
MDPNNSDALVELAHDQMKRGRQSNYRSAKNYYERSVKADDNQLEGWLGYGQASYYLRDDQNAEKAFLKIIEKDPEYSLAYSYLSKISSDKGKIREARSYIEKAIELEPEYYDYWVDYGQSLRLTGDLNGAVKAWTKAIELNPQYFLSYVYRASALDELKKYDESILDYRKIIQLNANYNYAYENLGMLEWKNGNWTKARECFEIALKKDPTSLSYKLMIAASYLREKNREGSKKFIDSHIRNLNKSSAEYYILRLYLDGINPSAVDVRVRKLESVVTKGKMLFYLGLFYDMYGNDEMAKRYYIEVQAMQAPMMFEYQMNEWLLNGECARLYEKKE